MDKVYYRKFLSRFFPFLTEERATKSELDEPGEKAGRATILSSCLVDGQYRSDNLELLNELTVTRRSLNDLEVASRVLRLKQKDLVSKVARISEESEGQTTELIKRHAAEVDQQVRLAKLEGARSFKESALKLSTKFGYCGSTVGSSFGFSPEAFYGGQHHKDIRILERIAMKTGSYRARRAIALGATDQRNTYEELIMIARTHSVGLIDLDLEGAVRHWNRRSYFSLVRVIADQCTSPSDPTDAVALYKLAISVFGRKSFDQRSINIYLETLQILGSSEEMAAEMVAFDVMATNPVQGSLLRCNELTATGLFEGDAVHQWLDILSPIYSNANLAPITYSQKEAGLLDCLSADAEPVYDGPLVSVLMATFNGTDRILTAIQSVMNQSWKNLELVIVDDYSDERHWDVLNRYSLLDSRIRVFRLDENQGAYRARNFAFEMATGVYVTVHDDDDWSHPQKVETQVRHLMAHPEVVGNMSFQTRIDEEFKFVRINDNTNFNQRNYSSMMLERDLVRRLGGWIDINRAADAEFHDRVRTLTGKQIVGLETAPLSFMRARTGSLTSNEIRKGALDFARQTLGLLYLTWHKSLTPTPPNSLDDLDSPSYNLSRPFPVPNNMLPGERRSAFGNFDVVFLTDFRFPGGNSSLVAAEIEAAVGAGLRVGVAQLDSPVLRANHTFNNGVAEVIERLSVPILTIEDDVSTTLLIIRNPTVLQFAERLRPALSPNRVIVVVNTAPVGQNGANFCYDLVDCMSSVQEMFGATAEIYPESPQMRNLVHSIFPNAHYSDRNWTGFINPSPYLASRLHDESRQPIVGRHSRDHSLKWPDTAEEIRSAYVQPDHFGTHILGGTGSVSGRLALSLEPSVVVSEFGTIDPPDFLSKIDFWVYLHSTALTESFGMSIVEAMASGAVVLLPPYMEALFGDAALYVSASDVAETVAVYWGDSALYNEQSRRGIESVKLHFSDAAFSQRLISLVQSNR
ncbi:glycosyltransferase [Arthrobacter sp. CAL618]|uniref:glycosyltransferase n=1 Tax=Arthrobacter sp. CAL618 TaxID=1055770 RepID=UPI00041CA7BE|nr:glycosyltransferase [Arthrobacter sp. CAL618]